MAFAAQTSNRLVEDRIALNGTVGPYQLSRADVILHSRTVRLVTVSRFDASEELDSRIPRRIQNRIGIFRGWQRS